MPVSRLRLDDLEKSFGPKPVLKGVSVAVRPSEFVAVVGKSGCGKSTLLRLIAVGSTSRARARSFSAKSRSRAVNPRVRVVFQDHRLLPWKRTLDNVALGLGRDWASEALALLGHMGLAERANDLPGTLSGGEKQRVSLARALLTRPGLLLSTSRSARSTRLTRIGMQGLIEAALARAGVHGALDHARRRRGHRARRSRRGA